MFFNWKYWSSKNGSQFLFFINRYFGKIKKYSISQKIVSSFFLILVLPFIFFKFILLLISISQKIVSSFFFLILVLPLIFFKFILLLIFTFLIRYILGSFQNIKTNAPFKNFTDRSYPGARFSSSRECSPSDVAKVARFRLATP